MRVVPWFPPSPRVFLFAWATICLSFYAAGRESAYALDWNQWRGPTRDGQVSGVDWPSSLRDEHWKREWRVDLGPSYSGPLVTADRVFTTETVDRAKEVVRAFERATGKPLWSFEWEGALSVPFFAKSNGDWIRSTPAFDGERLYVAGMRDVLVCLRASDGKQLWRRDFVAEMKTPVPSFGFVCSPLVVDGSVYVQAGAAFLKLDALTGETRWKSLADNGGMEGSAFSSPTFVTLEGQPQLVVQTRQKLAGVAPDSGEVLWSEEVPAFRGMNILTPVLHEGRFFTSAYGGKSLAYTVKRDAGKYSVSTAWENKSQGYMSTPVIIDGHAYIHLRNQRFTCIQLETGEQKWTTPKTFGKYWSLVANKDRILALDERGDLLLIQADPKEFKLIDERHISDEETWAHLAVSGQQVIVRDLKGLSVYTWK